MIMKTKVRLSAVGHVDETIEVEAFDIGEFYVCFRCGTLGFDLDGFIRAKIEFPIRALTAKDIVGEMDVRETYEHVPFCVSCGDKVLSVSSYKVASGAYEKVASK
jgi:hypothetical protein